MQRERQFQNDRTRLGGDSGPAGDGLNQQRDEVDGLLQASDRTFDAINSLHAQDYLNQNLQTGGQ